MTPPAVCCNPHGKGLHNNFRKNVRLVTENWKSRFHHLKGKYICVRCRMMIENDDETPNLPAESSSELQPVNVTTEETSDYDDYSTDCDSDDDFDENIVIKGNLSRFLL